MAALRDLLLWLDPVKRPGPEAMAVDQWLLETTKVPVLRVYEWLGEWGTLGYFGELQAAQAAFPGLPWVRRWTGGGTVDHRNDWTYTLVVPGESGIHDLRGAESYRCVHAALVEALVGEGVAARLSSGDEETGHAACFDNPVGHDVMGPNGRKIAGAGQRRNRFGLLHQGSVALPCEGAESLMRARLVVAALADSWREVVIEPDVAAVQAMVAERYGALSWTGRR